jgi:hypothetical protein
MIQYVIKIVLSVIVMVAVTELSKREAWWGALLASLPIVSLLSLVWLWQDTGDTVKVSAFAWSVFWLVLPSLALFLALPLLLHAGWNFWAALATGCALTVVLYTGELWLLPKIGVTL